MESVIAGNVKRIIKSKGYKQGAIAKMAGFSEQAFSNMLNGRKLITDCDVAKIVCALGVTPNEIFGINTGQRSA